MRSPILSHQEFGFGIIPYFWPPVKVFSSSAPLLPGCFLVEASHVAGFTSSLAFFINSIFANFKTKKKKGVYRSAQSNTPRCAKWSCCNIKKYAWLLCGLLVPQVSDQQVQPVLMHLDFPYETSTVNMTTMEKPDRKPLLINSKHSIVLHARSLFAYQR